jgi:hypothetical protein
MGLPPVLAAGRPALVRDFFNQIPRQFALLPEDVSN